MHPIFTQIDVEAFEASSGFSLQGTLIATMVTGSWAHGTQLLDAGERSSDVDLKGIVIPPLERDLGLGARWERWRGSTESDAEVYSLRSFISSALDGSPSVTDLLWTPRDMVVGDGVWDELVARREEFVSLQFARRMFRMAQSQLIKMQQSVNPTRKLGAKRKAMVEDFSYDPKNGSHMIRSFRMAREIAEEGQVIVRRPDASLLLKVKTGAFSLDYLREMGEVEAASAQKAIDKSQLREAADREVWDRWFTETMRERIGVPQIGSGRSEAKSGARTKNVRT